MKDDTHPANASLSESPTADPVEILRANPELRALVVLALVYAEVVTHDYCQGRKTVNFDHYTSICRALGIAGTEISKAYYKEFPAKTYNDDNAPA